MGVKVIYLEVAIRDLQSIYKYISRDSKKYARLEVNKIKSFIESLKSFPLKGKYYETIKDQEIRSVVFRNYIIFHLLIIYVDPEDQRGNNFVNYKKHSQEL